MKLKEFLSKNGMSTSVEIKESPKCYQGTAINILFLSLSKPVDDQDYLVCSKNLAEELNKDSSYLKQAEVRQTPEGWGLIKPVSCKTLATVEL